MNDAPFLAGHSRKDISKFDGDTELLIECIDKLSELQKTFPFIKKTVTVTVSDLSDGDFAITKNSTIVINVKALRSRTITIENIMRGKQFASRRVDDIVTHEFGHIIANVIGNRGIEISREAYYNLYGRTLYNNEIYLYLVRNISKYSVTQNESGKFKEVIPEVLVSAGYGDNEFAMEFIRLMKEGM